MLILWETKSEGRLLTNVRKNFLTLGEEDADDANIHQNGGYWFLTAAVTRPPTYWLLARWTYYLQFFRSVVGRRFPWATATVSRPYSFWGCREELTYSPFPSFYFTRPPFLTAFAPSDLCFHLQLSFPTLTLFPPSYKGPVIGPSWIIQGSLPPLAFLNSITFAKSLCHVWRQVNRSWGWGHGPVWGVGIILPPTRCLSLHSFTKEMVPHLLACPLGYTLLVQTVPWGSPGRGSWWALWVLALFAFTPAAFTGMSECGWVAWLSDKAGWVVAVLLTCSMPGVCWGGVN